MHILMVTDFYWPHLGGVEQHVRTLSKELCRRGHRVTVATLRTDGLANSERDGDVEVARLSSTTQRLPLFRQRRPWAPPLPDPRAALALRNIIREIRPDVIHGHDWLARSLLPLSATSPPLVSTLHYFTLSCPKKDLLRFGKPCDGPSIAKCLPCASDHYGLSKGVAIVGAARLGAALDRSATRQFVAVSAAAARGNHLDPHSDTCIVIPNFLSESISEASEDEHDPLHSGLLDQLPEGEFFLYVGDFRSAKGYEVLLAAYASLNSHRPLVAIGKRWPSTPASVPEGVQVFENWPNAAVREATRRARCLVVPSVWAEPFGIVAIEAMSVGTPVVASATGGLGTIIDHDISGLLVIPASAQSLAAAIGLLDSNDSLCRRLGEGALAAAKRFEAAHVVPLIERCYQTAIQSVVPS